jgi:hypothetical protein
MRLRAAHLLRYFVLLGSLACSDPTAPRAVILDVDRRADGLELRNLTSAPVYYLALETELLPLINYALCTVPTSCTSLPARGSRLLPFDELFCCRGEDRHLTIFHYHLVPVPGGGFRPDLVRQLGVQL